MPLNTPRITIPLFTLWIVIALVVGFAIGFLIQYPKVRHLKEVESQLRLATLRDELTQAHLELLKNNFGTAQTLCTQFFNDLRAFLSSTKDDALKLSLTPVLMKRDLVTKSLSTANPDAGIQIRQMMDQLYQATSTQGK